MMLTWVFWLSFWSALLGGPDEPPDQAKLGGFLMPVPLALPRPSATVTNLAAWRAEHRPQGPTEPDRQGPTGGRAA